MFENPIYMMLSLHIQSFFQILYHNIKFNNQFRKFDLNEQYNYLGVINFLKLNYK